MESCASIEARHVHALCRGKQQARWQYAVSLHNYCSSLQHTQLGHLWPSPHSFQPHSGTPRSPYRHVSTQRCTLNAGGHTRNILSKLPPPPTHTQDTCTRMCNTSEVQSFPCPLHDHATVQCTKPHRWFKTTNQGSHLLCSFELTDSANHRHPILPVQWYPIPFLCNTSL